MPRAKIASKWNVIYVAGNVITFAIKGIIEAREKCNFIEPIRRDIRHGELDRGKVNEEINETLFRSDGYSIGRHTTPMGDNVFSMDRER